MTAVQVHFHVNPKLCQPDHTVLAWVLTKNLLKSSYKVN